LRTPNLRRSFAARQARTGVGALNQALVALL
jgi:hypothetical protein